MLASSAVYCASSTGSNLPGRASGRQPREVKQRVDEFQQPLAVAGDDLDPAAVRFAERVLGVGQRILGWSEEQRQRRPQLVADVGEERGLGPVELGQLLCPPALRRVGAGAGDAGGQLGGDQPQERPVCLVERAIAVDSHDQESVRCRSGDLLGQRQHQRGGRRLLPASGGQRSELLLEVPDDDGSTSGQLTQRPARRLVRQSDALRGRSVAGGDAGRRGQLGAGALVVEQVHHAERKRSTIGLEVARGRAHVLAFVPGRRGFRSEVTKGGHSPLSDHPIGVLADHAEHSDDRTAVVGERAV